MDINSKLLTISRSIGLSALDVGARRGVGTDLLSLGPAIDFYAFEPDPEECIKLNKHQSAPWKSLIFIPTALGDCDGDFNLNLYRQRGCSSKLKALQEVGKLFSRGEYYIHDGVVNVPMKKLDDVIQEYNIECPAFMKIDVQGMECDVFKGGHNSLSNSLVAIRTEVNFFPLYEELPLFSEVEQTLRPYGFVPMRFLEMHEWRRTTKKKLPMLGPMPMPYSRGQMIHGDVLFMLHPEYLPAENDKQIKRLVRLALIAVCYDHFDHAEAVFKIPRVRQFTQEVAATDPLMLIHELSKSVAAPYKGFRGLSRKVFQKIFK
jgi:FkbM family methyltransferase